MICGRRTEIAFGPIRACVVVGPSTGRRFPSDLLARFDSPCVRAVRRGDQFDHSMGSIMVLMRRELLIGTVTFVLVGLGPAAIDRAVAADSFDEIEKKSLALLDKIKTVTAKIKLDFEARQGENWVINHTTGTAEYLIKDGTVLSRLDLKSEVSTFTNSNETKETKDLLLLTDGKYTWNQGVQKGKRLVYKFPIDPVQSAISTREYFEVLRRDYDITVLPEQELDGKKTWVIEANRKPEGNVPRIKTVINFRQDAPLMVRTVNFDPGGTKVQETFLHDVKVDAAIPPERFKYKPPPDYQVLDLTGEAPPENVNSPTIQNAKPAGEGDQAGSRQP